MPPRILIVEDEAILALDLKETLQDAGYSIVGICHNAQEALSISRELHPELVLMDIKLEGPMSGTEAAHLLYHEQEIPVVFLTSYLDKKTLDAAYSASPYGYLSKPYRPESLAITVRLALDQHRRERQLAMNLHSLQHQQSVVNPQHFQLSTSTSYQLFSGQLLQGNATIRLTAKEKTFLDLLASNAGNAVSFDSIYETVWQTRDNKIQPLRTLLHRLRAKTGGGHAIESVHETGYRLHQKSYSSESVESCA